MNTPEHSVNRRACQEQTRKNHAQPTTHGSTKRKTGTMHRAGRAPLPRRGPSQEQREIGPVGLLRTSRQRLRDPVEDRAELTMVDADDDRAARVHPSRLGPAPRDHGEVLDVERDEQPSFVRGERQQLLVGEAVELALLVRGAHVVAGATQRTGDAWTRDVRVEKQLHRASGAGSDTHTADGYERKLLFKLLDRPAVFGDGHVDLLGKPLVVAERQANLALTGRTALRHALDRSDVPVGIDDLPYVERGPDHPRATLPVRAARRDRRGTAASGGRLVNRVGRGLWRPRPPERLVVRGRAVALA